MFERVFKALTKLLLWIAAPPLVVAALMLAALWVCGLSIGLFINRHPWPVAFVLVAGVGFYMVGGG